MGLGKERRDLHSSVTGVALGPKAGAERTF